MFSVGRKCREAAISQLQKNQNYWRLTCALSFETCAHRRYVHRDMFGHLNLNRDLTFCVLNSVNTVHSGAEYKPLRRRTAQE
jgi:hypothetical protein